MKRLESPEALNQLKKLPFSKSWQNVFITKTKKIFDIETKTLKDTELTEFIYAPAPSLIRYFSNDNEFLRFRSEYKTASDWNFNLVSDPIENNNRRLVIMWVANILEPLGINFLIDDGYTLYIMYSELQKLSNSDIPGMKEFINGLYIPKIIAHKKGVTETFSN